MDAELNKKIEAAIKDSLPSAVGDVLRQRLATCDSLEVEVKRLKDERDSLNDKLAKHRPLDDRERAAIAAEQKLAERERSVLAREVRQELIEAGKKAAEEKASFALQVVGLVFANNRFKYQEFASVPGQATAGNPYQPTVNTSKTVEGEG